MQIRPNTAVFVEAANLSYYVKKRYEILCYKRVKELLVTKLGIKTVPCAFVKND